jgi:hypothetical protein
MDFTSITHELLLDTKKLWMESLDKLSGHELL